MTELLAKQIRDLTFDIERSVRYHSRRRAFFETFDTVVNTTNLILGSAAFAGLVTQRLPYIAMSLVAAAVALVSFINLTTRSSEQASLHSQLQQRWVDLLKQVKRLDITADSSSRGLKRCVERRLDIERDEPPIYRVVDLLSHNEQVRAQGGPDTDIWVIPFWKALFANFWRFETGDIESLATYRERGGKK